MSPNNPPKAEPAEPGASKTVTVAQLQAFILHESKGVALLEGSIELPDTAVVAIINHYLERYHDAGINLPTEDSEANTRQAKAP